jgi:hypothetical protein
MGGAEQLWQGIRGRSDRPWLGTALQFGKEWWVEGEIGLGLIGRFHASNMRMKDQDARMTALTFSFVLSFTYN